MLCSIMVRKSLNCPQHFFSVIRITDHYVLISLYYFDRDYTIQFCQKIFQLICLSACHSFLTDMKSNSASDFMFYFKSHIVITFSYEKHLQFLSAGALFLFLFCCSFFCFFKCFFFSSIFKCFLSCCAIFVDLLFFVQKTA